MTYNPKNWQYSDIISEDELNRMEQGITEAHAKADAAQESADHHASRHATGGPDEITPESIGAETPAGAQAKADHAEAAAKEYTDQHISKVNEDIAAIEEKLETQNARVHTISERMSIIHTDQATPLHLKRVEGRTLVNLVGKGNDVTKYVVNIAEIPQIFEVDMSDKVVGENSIKYKIENGSSYKAIPCNFEIGRSYLVCAYIKSSDGTATGRVAVRLNSGSYLASSPIRSTEWKMGYFTFTASGDEQGNAGISLWDPNGNNYIKFNGLRVYEISSSEMTYINSLPVEVAEKYIEEKYSYIESLKNISGIYIRRYGNNLVPPFNEWTDFNDSVIEEPYKLTITTTSGTSSNNIVIIPALPDTVYSYCHEGNGRFLVQELDASGNIIHTNFSSSDSIPVTIRTNSKTRMFRLFANTIATWSGTYQIINPMLNIGSEVISFEPRHDDYLYVNVELASKQDGSNVEVLDFRDGRYWKTKKYKKVVLDSLHNWDIDVVEYTGFKVITFKTDLSSWTSPEGNSHDSVIAVKYDGKILSSRGTSTHGADNAFFVSKSLTDNKTWLRISVSNEDSGWGQGYLPTVEEVKAYFDGWRMFKNADRAKPYDGAGDKWWFKINKRPDPSVDSLPSTSYKEWTPYYIQYELETPVVVDVTNRIEGSISLSSGENLVEIGEAAVYKEMAKTGYNNGVHYIINHRDQSPLDYYASRMISVYKNGSVDTQWELWMYGSSTSKGPAWARIALNKFQPSATYQVTYIAEMWDRSVPVQSLSVEYDTSIKSSLDRTVQKVSNLETKVSELPTIYASKFQENWIRPTILNGWAINSNVEFFKDSLGIVHLKGSIAATLSASRSVGTVIFRLPEGYRPKGTVYIPAVEGYVLASKLASMLEISTNGDVKLANEVSSTYLTFNATFRAER